MEFRKALETDIERISEIYDLLHTEEERGNVSIGWLRGVYPVRETAEEALLAEELYVLTDGGKIVASARLNNVQMPSYKAGKWKIKAADDEVFVMHTLTVDPALNRKGYGKAFVKFYNDTAKEKGYRVLRIDTQAKNVNARSLYASSGFSEAGIVPCDFCGIPDVDLCLLERRVL